MIVAELYFDDKKELKLDEKSVFKLFRKFNNVRWQAH